MSPILTAGRLYDVAEVDLARMGAEIEKERNRQGLSQADLGARMVPPRHQVVVDRIESGGNQLKAKMLEQICKALLGDAGLGIMQLRAGWIDLDLPSREMLGIDRTLSPRGRRIMQDTYDLVREAEAKEGLTPPEQPPGDVVP